MGNLLPKLEPPHFPTFQELVDLQTNASSPPSEERGLFEALIGEPVILFDDLLRDPQKYEPGVETLLQELITGQKKLAGLTQAEKDLLNRATLDFAQRSKTKTASAKPPQAQMVESPFGDSPEVDSHEGIFPEGAVDIASWFGQ